MRRKPRSSPAGGDTPVGALGSGSDYSAFLQHLGLATINLGFGGEDDQGRGLSLRLRHLRALFPLRRSDLRATAWRCPEVSGRLVLREADADILPLQFGGFADTVAGYVEELKKLDTDMMSQDRDADQAFGRSRLRPGRRPGRDRPAPHRRRSPRRRSTSRPSTPPWRS